MMETGNEETGKKLTPEMKERAKTKGWWQSLINTL